MTARGGGQGPGPGSGGAPGYRWVVLAAATLAQASTAFLFLGVGALAAFFQDAYDLGGAETGLVVTAIAITPLFALLGVGRLLDHHSERPIITGGALLLAAGAVAAAYVQSYPLLLAALVVGGAGYTTSQPGGSKVVSLWFSDRERGLAMGIRQMGLPLGGAIAAAVLPALAERSGLRPALLTAAAVAAAGGLVFGLVDRHPPVAADRSGYGLRAEVRSLLRERPVRTAMWAGLGMVSAQLAIISYLILFLRDVHGLAVTTGAWMLFAAQMAGTAGRVVLAAWSDRTSGGRLVPIVAGMGMTALGAAAAPLLPADLAISGLAVFSAAFGFFAFGWYGPWVVHVAEIAPRRAVGLTLALAMTGNQLAIVLSPPIFGLILDASGGYTASWLAVAGFVALAATRVGGGLWRRRDRIAGSA